MAYVHSLADVLAPPRGDGVSWTEVRIERSVTGAAPWTQDDVVALTPDPTPAEPTPFLLTFQSPEPAAWFRLVFFDGVDTSPATAAVYDDGSDAFVPGWTPTVEQVAALVRVRTQDDLGNQVGTFTQATRPTNTQVQELIRMEAAIMGARLGDLDALGCPTAEDIRTAAGALVAKRVAALVEAGYRPEELAEGRTAEGTWSAQFTADVQALQTAASACAAWQPDDQTGGSGPAPRWHFGREPSLRW